MEKSCKKCVSKVSLRSLLILVNNPKQPLDAINSFKSKIFWKTIIKNPKKDQLYFFFKTQSFSVDKVTKKGAWN